MYNIYDVIVVGAGHAGCEAALVSQRLGCSTLLITLNLETVAKMFCNPAIGGLAKGQLVREVDALGGEMAKVIDETGIQFRMLNRSKGPAVWSPRAQADNKLYSSAMKRHLEEQPGLTLMEGMVTSLLVEKGRVEGVVTGDGRKFCAKAVIVTTGTFLNSLIHIGLNNYTGGPADELAAVGFTRSIIETGHKADRFKTGTPPRLDGRTINWDVLEIQHGDENPSPFSYQTEKIEREQITCYITHTNPETHGILREGLERSPLYTGIITSLGPRYCPSVETKIVRFPNNEHHQIFLEPEGLDTDEIYVNGFSTSLPDDIQIRGIHSIKGLEKAELLRFGYAIEYDYFPPDQIHQYLESRIVSGLYFAGQVNGTSGYEEAAAQGLMAGINAALKIRGEPPFVLKRDEAYIGVLIDDLITKGVDEPYRMFTSRAEYRLLLRQDNADERLMEYGYNFGLIPWYIYNNMKRKKEMVQDVINSCREIRVHPEQVNTILASRGSSPITQAESIRQLLKRPEMHLSDLLPCFPEKIQEELHGDTDVGTRVEIEVKYKGYIDRQYDMVRQLKRYEEARIPEGFSYKEIRALSTEARDKLEKSRPRSVGQALRIPGITPSDGAVLMVYLKKVKTVPFS